ncbi:uncharacterized protein LOC129302125 [Prosopis cineraria]|uniref:uncharacterized protein LOC129302125 n=1 Tax=Prosopis cineraria TaxID=364024 RepID=UPI00241040FC|nr:uncharacterized protein LOC129302125 [Prosopis cineraria]
MAHKFCFEALDKCLKDILKFSNLLAANLPFEGKVVVFGGDFKQILPVIPSGSREEIVFATINSSYIWDNCQLLTLTRNMRLMATNTIASNSDIQNFTDWIISIGDRTAAGVNEGSVDIKIPANLLLDGLENSRKSIVDLTFLNFLNNVNNSSYFRDRAILAPTLAVIEEVNKYMLSMIPGEEVVYLSSDSIVKDDGDINSLDDLFPFTLKRRQFSIMLAFAMTINKSQGQSLCNVGLYLPRPVFMHNQLYVAVSRVQSKEDLKILVLNEDGQSTDKTSNVVYREVFDNLV